MKKEANYNKNKVIRRNTGLPRDDIKELEEFKSKLRKELAEEMEKDKKKAPAKKADTKKK